jgi:D-beta-D-heptose 7-phosphate kinase/D-beta-D-heptose 1-phosphate adenosyltransferase
MVGKVAFPSSLNADLVSRLAGKIVVVVGDVMLDHFVYGSVERISPEAPIVILKKISHATMLGGAGNVARNISSLGGICRLVAAVGEDANASSLQEAIRANPGVQESLIRVATWPTTVKTRFVTEEGRQQLLRMDEEAPFVHTKETYQILLNQVRVLLDDAGALILSDYGKGFLDSPINSAMIALARERSLPVIVDPKGRDYSCYRGATIVTPNRKETEDATGMPAQSDEEVVVAARELISRYQFQFVLVTRSSKGMSLIGADGHFRHLPTQAQEVFDVSGAGDTVVGTLALGLAADISLSDSVSLANSAAGVVVAKAGTAVVLPHEIQTSLLSSGQRRVQKISSLDNALQRLEEWRQQGLSIGFTNGCFDLLHAGHVHLLDFARGQCDRLIVGLNSDASVKALKGPSRPVQTEAVRSTVLSSMESPDMVVIFEEQTPLKLIEIFSPDVLIKGSDYNVNTVVGADFVISNGGRVVFCPLMEGQSTTATIAKLNHRVSG